MRKIYVFCLCLLVLTLPIGVSAKSGKSKKLSVKAFTKDSDDSGIVAAAWMPDQGLADAGGSNHALYLQKAGPTVTNASAGAKIKWLDDLDISVLLELGFDYRFGGHCTANSPRFVVTVDGTDHLLGCASGLASPAPDDPVNWVRVRFGAPEFVAAGIPTIGTIDTVRIIFDEGTEFGSGLIFMDNVDVNGDLIGKPGKGGPKK